MLFRVCRGVNKLVLIVHNSISHLSCDYKHEGMILFFLLEQSDSGAPQQHPSQSTQQVATESRMLPVMFSYITAIAPEHFYCVSSKICLIIFFLLPFCLCHR